MKIDPNAPAYPFDPETTGTTCRGMTIRAAMATEIMAAIVGGCERGEQHDPRIHRDHAAKDAVRYVDALIAALNEEKP